MTEPTSSMGRTKFFDRIGAQKGWPSDQTKWSSEQIIQAQRILDDAYSRFILAEMPHNEGGASTYCHTWSFLTGKATIKTTAEQSADELPDDFGEAVGRMFLYGANEPYLRGYLVDQYTLLQKQQVYTSSSYPFYGCIMPVAATSGKSQRWEIHWVPTPGAEYTIYIPYRVQVNELSASNPYPLGGAEFSHVIAQACMAESEGEAGVETGKYLRMLAAAIAKDQAKQRRIVIDVPDGAVVNHLTYNQSRAMSWSRW